MNSNQQSVRFWTDDGFEVVLADDYDALVEQLEAVQAALAELLSWHPQLPQVREKVMHPQHQEAVERAEALVESNPASEPKVYAVWNTTTSNLLNEFETREEAEAFLHELGDWADNVILTEEEREDSSPASRDSDA